MDVVYEHITFFQINHLLQQT